MDGTKQRRKKGQFRYKLAFIDLLIYLFICVMILIVYPRSVDALTGLGIAEQIVLGAVLLAVFRIALGVYRQIWRYGNMASYLYMILSDAAAALLFIVLRYILPIQRLTVMRAAVMFSVNLLAGMTARICYQYLYLNRNKQGMWKVARRLIDLFLNNKKSDTDDAAAPEITKIKIGIVGAGRVGVMLAEELINNEHSPYIPVCFVDISPEKIGRSIYSIPVLSEDDVTPEEISNLGIQEFVFAVHESDKDKLKVMYDTYKKTGCQIKVYDYPTMQTAGSNGGKRRLREFDIEELLFRKPIAVIDNETKEYYRGKTVLITGGGGSIGSELCRQIACMEPEKLIILDVYENGAYDIQQELAIAYGQRLKLFVEISTVCDKNELEVIFNRYRPDVVLHAAAHKHVPFSEHNVCEVVKNNVFGTLNVINACEKYGVGRFIMISTDKAVNPTNVMGATKRMCEMIVLSRHKAGESGAIYSATRFGNVLGSAGSVIPLFKRQIAAGGPITLTDYRIIRYFMTIPEATSLVLRSGRMAKDGELFVLDMGAPVKILDLAINMIKLSGLEPDKDIKVIETGLRPGEKLYEELLIKSKTQDKTSDDSIFIERGEQVEKEYVDNALEDLHTALKTNDDDIVRAALHRAVPTFIEPQKQ